MCFLPRVDGHRPCFCAVGVKVRELIKVLFVWTVLWMFGLLFLMEREMEGKRSIELDSNWAVL